MGNISGWTEGILFTLAFVAVLGIVIAGFNGMYGKSYNLGLSDNNTENLFIEYQDSASQNIKGGEVEFDAQQGISLKSSYGLAKDAMSIIWSFFTGGFIETAISYMNLGSSGTILAKTLRILWFLSLVFALLYALFKIKL